MSRLQNEFLERRGAQTGLGRLLGDTLESFIGAPVADPRLALSRPQGGFQKKASHREAVV